MIRVSHVAQRATQTALEGPRDWIYDLAARYRADRDAAHAVIADHPNPGRPLRAASPFLWLNLGRLKSENRLAAGILVVDGVAFGTSGYTRLLFAGAASLKVELRVRLVVNHGWMTVATQSG